MTIRALAAVALFAPALAAAASTASSDPGAGPTSSAADAKATSGKRSKAAATPSARARRTLQVRSASALLPARPAPARLAARPSGTAGPPESAFELGVVGGYEADRAAGLSLRVDGAQPLRDLNGRVRLSLVGSLGWSRLAQTAGLLGVTADVFKLVPAARFTLPLAPRFSVFGDAGVGFAYVRARLVSNAPAFPFTSTSGTLNLMARIGAGAWYDVGARLRLGALLELDPIFGDFGYTGSRSQSPLLFLVGAMLRV